MPIIRPFLKRIVERQRISQPGRRILNLAHRGAAGDAPQNTMAAFELALRQGADGIELDVRLSSDGVPVVIHDARLDRTTSGHGWVSAYSVSALKRLDAGSWFNRKNPANAQRRFEALRIPTLAEVLEWTRDRACCAYVEIKQGGDDYPGIEARVLEAIHRAGAVQVVTVISFDFAALRRLRALDAEILLGASFSRPLLALRRAKSVGARCVALHRAFASRRLIRRAHKAGLSVVAWTVNQPDRMRRKISDGVDGIITNFPGRLAEVCDRLRGAASGDAFSRRTGVEL